MFNTEHMAPNDCGCSEFQPQQNQLRDMFGMSRVRLQELVNKIKEIAEKNPTMAIFLGVVLLFCGIPLTGFLIFFLVATLILLTLFVIAEGLVLSIGLLFLAGFILVAAGVGVFAGILVATSYAVVGAVRGKYPIKMEFPGSFFKTEVTVAKSE